jgi:hypothetical protein
VWHRPPFPARPIRGINTIGAAPAADGPVGIYFIASQFYDVGQSQ